MTAPLLVAILFFLIVVTLTVGLWWVTESRRTVRARLGGDSYQAPPGIVRGGANAPRGVVERAFGGSALYGRFVSLVLQSGIKQTPGDVGLIVLAFIVIGGAVAWLRTGELLWGLLAAPVAGAIPLSYVAYTRQRRLRLFESQFPDALDMIGRAIRAGNALSAAIRIVGEEMPDPIGHEFRQVSEEIRLGMEPGEALFRLQERAPVQDMGFFCTALRIQRASGGNLAEVLDRLAEVVRERFKILSYARVLAAQHKWSAVFVGLSPVIIAVVFQLIRPGYFDALLASPSAPFMIGAGIALEAIGFFTIWRIAQIEV